MDSAITDEDSEEEPRDTGLDPGQQGTPSAEVPIPQQLPVDTRPLNPADSATQVQLENVDNSSPATDKPSLLDTSSTSGASPSPLRRSSRVRKAPERLIETL